MKPVHAVRLLDTCDDVDSGWLTSVLHAAGHDDAEVEAFTTSPIGAGNVSDTIKVMLRFAGPTAAPASLVCKFRCREAQAHAHGVGSGSYFRELHSYRALIASGAASGVTCRTPRVLWVDGTPENINLVMEDLTPITRAGDQVAGCSIADARSVVTELARLHRAFYPMAQADAPAWGMTMAGTADYWADAIAQGLPVVRDHARDRLGGAAMAIIEDAACKARAWYELPMERGTLTHGDPRVDNILFIDDATTGPQAVLIDWQVTGWRNPMHDLGYFLSGSVTVEDRRAAEAGLLDHYADVFGAAPGYTRALIERDYRLHLPSGLMTTLAAYGVLPMTPAVDRLLLALVQRNVAAVADWGSLDLL